LLIHPVFARLEPEVPAVIPLRGSDFPAAPHRFSKAWFKQLTLLREHKVRPGPSDGVQDSPPLSRVQAVSHTEQVPHRSHAEELLLEGIAFEPSHTVESPESPARAVAVPTAGGHVPPLIAGVEAVESEVEPLELLQDRRPDVAIAFEDYGADGSVAMRGANNISLGASPVARKGCQIAKRPWSIRRAAWPRLTVLPAR